MQKLYIAREGVMAAVIVFSIVVIGVNAHFIFTEMNDELLIDDGLFIDDEFAVWPTDTPDTFAVLNIAVAVLTLLTVPLMLLINRFRSGAFPSMIFFELTWLGVLCVLWIAAASFTVTSVKFLLALCSLSFNKRVSVLQSACKDIRVSEAMGHLAWLALLGYVTALFFLSYKSAQAGQPVWRKSVGQTTFVTNFHVPTLGNENAGRHENGAKDSDPAIVQNLGYAYPPNTAQPLMQQYDPSQPQLQQPRPQQGQLPGQVDPLQASYGQPQYSAPIQPPVQTPYGTTQV